MQPIHELLNRIHWDPEFGRGRFEIGYYDRLEKKIIRVPFMEVTQMPGNKFSFHVFDEDNIGHAVPMHRVREVYKDGELIWKRDPKAQKESCLE
jgi:uncharacterized protein (UPF0248 family)